MLKKLKIKPYKHLLFLFFLQIAIVGVGKDFKDGPYDHRIFSINQGYSFSGSGDCWGIGNEISHLKTFLPGVFHRESISSWLINGSSWITDGYEHQSGIDYSMEIGFSPLLRKNRLLSFTGGGCVSYQTILSPNGGGTWSIGDSYMSTLNYKSEIRICPGFTLGLNYHTKVNSKIWLNMRAAIRSYSGRNVVSIFSVGIGYDPTN